MADIIVELYSCRKNFKSIVRGLTWAVLRKMERSMQSGSYTDAGGIRDIMLDILPAINHISQNYMNQIRIKELADLCNSSQTSFRRNFKASLGTSPLEYIEKVRIQTASILLRNTDSPILEISLKVGYFSLSSFNRSFKRNCGVSPREFLYSSSVVKIDGW